MKINRRTALAALAAATTVNLDSQTAKADNHPPKVQFYEVEPRDMRWIEIRADVGAEK